MSSQATAELAADPRVIAGFDRQLELRRRRLEAGERPLGWKLGFNAPAAREALGIAAPLVGFLTDASILATPEIVSVGGWSRPLLEPEVAVRIGRAPTPGGSLEDAAASIGGLAPAFELADLEPPPTDVEEILAGNIFHRAVVLGEVAEAAAEDLGALSAELARGDRAPESIPEPQGATGPIPGLIRHLADLLHAFGVALAPGEIVICGSIVPPIAVGPGDRLRYRLAPVGALEIELRS